MAGIQPQRLSMDVDAIVARCVETLQGIPSIRFAYLFGSLARGTALPFSDVDIAVYVDEFADVVTMRLDLYERLVDCLGSDRVDVVVLNTAPLTLKARVVRCNRILVDLYPSDRHAFESLVLREYYDFSRVEEAILRRRFGIG